MIFAHEIHTSGVYVSQHVVGLFKPSKRFIRVREIALRDEHVAF